MTIGPTVWSSLSDWLRDPAVESERFRRDLKTHLFAGHRGMSTLGVLPYRNRHLLTYLLYEFICLFVLRQNVLIQEVDQENMWRVEGRRKETDKDGSENM